MSLTAWIAGLAMSVAVPATAIAQSQRITTAQQFERNIVGRDLTRFGVSVSVSADGRITGSAFTRDVTGTWSWKDGYFCRELNWGSRALGYNCQEVMVEGSSVRFTSDQGAGRSAELSVN